MKSFIFGQTSQGLPILAHLFGHSGPNVLVLGGVHGDEWEGIVAAHALINRFSKAFSYKMRLTIVPMFNTDGAIRGERKNAQGIDLNRNLPTADWTAEVAEERYYPGKEPCEAPENRALVEWLDKNRPQFVLSLHSWKPLLNINGNCRAQAELIAKHTGYEIKDSIGYPTPGCLGTYCGLEREMPTLTYEIERGLDPSVIVGKHAPAIIECLKLSENPS